MGTKQFILLILLLVLIVLALALFLMIKQAHRDDRLYDPRWKLYEPEKKSEDKE